MHLCMYVCMYLCAYVSVFNSEVIILQYPILLLYKEKLSTLYDSMYIVGMFTPMLCTHRCVCIDQSLRCIVSCQSASVKFISPNSLFGVSV